MGATCSSTYRCIALISVSRSTPHSDTGTVALLKQAIVGIMPWLNAPNDFLVWFVWAATFFLVFIGVEMTAAREDVKIQRLVRAFL